MNEKTELSSQTGLADFGDAALETKERFPWPPNYPDSVYGFGKYATFSE